MNDDITASSRRDREISNVLLPIVIIGFSVLLGLEFLGWV